MAPAPPPPPPAAAAAPAARPVPDAASKPTQTARTVPSPAGTIAFPPAVAELPAGARPELDRVAQRLAGDERLHLQLLAFAEANDASQSRRLSLSRALAVRSYLLDRGVQPQKIELRPLGNRPEAGNKPDRVDLVFAER
jgi:outer membrane protein OmpA-like peptidoglycan-associated protein